MSVIEQPRKAEAANASGIAKLWWLKVKEQLVGERNAGFEHARQDYRLRISSSSSSKLILTKLRVGNMQARSVVAALASAFLITTIALRETPAAASEVIVIDGSGRNVQITDTSRILSIGGDVTEILYALGAGARIVGVDTTSQFPAEALHEKQSVGYMRALSSEGVISVGASVILASQGAGPPEVVKTLKATTVAYVEVSDNNSADGIVGKVRLIAKVVGAEVEGEKLAQKVRDDFKVLAETRAKITKPVTPARSCSSAGRATSGIVMALLGAPIFPSTWWCSAGWQEAEPVLEARDVTYKVQGTTLVHSVNLTIKPGRIAALIGPNGAGKSTLLRILAGELRATSAKCFWIAATCNPSPRHSRKSAFLVPQASRLHFPSLS